MIRGIRRMWREDKGFVIFWFTIWFILISFVFPLAVILYTAVWRLFLQVVTGNP